MAPVVSRARLYDMERRRRTREPKQPAKFDKPAEPVIVCQLPDGTKEDDVVFMNKLIKAQQNKIRCLTVRMLAAESKVIVNNGPNRT